MSSKRLLLVISVVVACAASSCAFAQELGKDWTQATPAMWSQRCGHTNVSFDGKLWMIGGQQDGTTTNSKNDVWWSADGLAWQEATDSAAFSARFGHTSVVFDGKMWVIGGCGPAHVQKSDVWWSTDGQNWNLATADAGFTPRRHHTSLVFDNKIWVIAGFTDTGPATALADVWYSSDGQNWSEATSSAAFGARHTAGAVYGGRMWVLGGTGDGLTRFNDAWWSTDGATWNNVPTVVAFPARSEHVAAVIDNKMWVIAGVVSPGTPSNHLHDAWWSVDGATWTQATSSAGFSPRRSPGCAVFDNGIWITGGYDGIAVLNDVWHTDSPLKPPKIKAHLSMGETTAYLTWDPVGPYNKYTYRVYVWERIRLWPSPWLLWGPCRVVSQIEGKPIHDPRAIVEGLMIDPLRLFRFQYAFGLAAVDQYGNEWPTLVDLSQTEIDKLPKGETTPGRKMNVERPTPPILFLPGVGAHLSTTPCFDLVKHIFSAELGWHSAPDATVAYPWLSNPSGDDVLLYSKGWPPSSIWPSDWNADPEDVIFTFIPYPPNGKDVNGEVLHEAGIAQKGLELGYFLSQTWASGRQFQLIGHSLGGLTARAYVQLPPGEQRNNYQSNVTRLVTTGTPHAGVAKDAYDEARHESKYPGEGLKEIITTRYYAEEWRKTAFKEDAWFNLLVFEVLNHLWPVPSWEEAFDLTLRGVITLVIEYLKSSGWDFQGDTLMKDVLYGSDLLSDLNGLSGISPFVRIPQEIRCVSLVGEETGFWSVFPVFGWIPVPVPIGGFNSYLGYGDRDNDRNYDNGDSDGSIIDGGDGIVSIDSQNLGIVLPSTRVDVINRALNHYEEENDYVGFLWALGYPVLSVKALSPVDIQVTAPSGQYIAREETAMWLATYREIEDDASPTPHDLVEIPFPESGRYTIEVVPDEDAPPDAVFTLTVTENNETTVLADSVRISDIPPDGYAYVVNTPPVADAGHDQTVYARADCMAEAVLDGAGSTDADGDALSYSWSWTLGGSLHTATGSSPAIQLPLGSHVIQLVVNDGHVDGDPDEVVITVLDNTPPRLAVTVNPSVLYPPNHKMIRITSAVTATDNCDAAPRVALKSVSMNEGDGSNTYAPGWDDSVGDGNTSGDIQVDTSGNIFLRAERAGTGSGRVYTITYEATDASSNSSRASAQVTVPHDLGTR